MVVIADSGSTKTDWYVISKDKTHSRFTTLGLNPYFIAESELTELIRGLIAHHLDQTQVSALFFYGAGCQGIKIELMKGIFRQVFPYAGTVEVNVDLLAAAKALLGDAPGFAAILGTGTNTCLYDGKNISYHIDSLGFILGDEGSGAAIGKRILIDFLRKKMPFRVREAFILEYAMNEDKVIDLLYSSPQPNRVCASFAKFLDRKDVDDTYVDDVVRSSFGSFFTQLVCLYPAYQQVEFNCAGSIAYRFADQLAREAARHHMPVGRIIPSVIEELAHYHVNGWYKK